MPDLVGPLKEEVDAKMSSLFTSPAENLQSTFVLLFGVMSKQQATLVGMQQELNQLKADVPNGVNKVEHQVELLASDLKTLEYNLLGQEEEPEQEQDDSAPPIPV